MFCSEIKAHNGWFGGALYLLNSLMQASGQGWCHRAQGRDRQSEWGHKEQGSQVIKQALVSKRHWEWQQSSCNVVSLSYTYVIVQHRECVRANGHCTYLIRSSLFHPYAGTREDDPAVPPYELINTSCWKVQWSCEDAPITWLSVHFPWVCSIQYSCKLHTETTAMATLSKA